MDPINQFIEIQRSILEKEKAEVLQVKNILLKFKQKGQLNHPQHRPSASVRSVACDEGAEKNHDSTEGQKQIQEQEPVENLLEAKKLRDMESGDVLFPNWLQLGGYEEKRRKLAQERHREYNEYLREKTRVETARQKARHLNFIETPILSLPDYRNILEKKKKEEHNYREANGLSIIEENGVLTQPVWNCYPEEDADGTLEKITPQSRLLRTDFLRAKALTYREELIQQIAEKKKRQEEERLRDRLLDAKIENRMEEQRKRMNKEYEEEQKRLKKKTNELIKRQEIAKITQENHHLSYSLPQRTLSPRSPSYLLVKSAKSPKPKTCSKNLNHIYLNNYEPKTSESEDQRIDFENNNNVLENGTINVMAMKDWSNELREKSNKKNQDRQDHVLSRLADVRKKMEEDHQKMLEQLDESRESSE